MSKAFTKEDAEIPERSGRLRPASGLPPCALNYLTADGAERLASELGRLRTAASDGERVASQDERIADLERALATATIVPAPEGAREEVLFGATVELRTAAGARTRYRIVGVDETHLTPDAISWITPLARALIGARVGEWVRAPAVPGGAAEVTAIDP